MEPTVQRESQGVKASDDTADIQTIGVEYTAKGAYQ